MRITIFSVAALVFIVLPTSLLAASFDETVRGRILLDVEAHGEAWYVEPDSLERYFLGRPTDAFEIMRNLGLGISNDDIAKIQVGLTVESTGADSDEDGLSDLLEDALDTDRNLDDSDGDGFSDAMEIETGFNPNGPGSLIFDLDLASRLSGTILLQVEKNGEAWYVNPIDNKRYFLGRPADAFAVMRELGLGISSANLDLVEIAPTSSLPPEEEAPAEEAVEEVPEEEVVEEVPAEEVVEEEIIEEPPVMPEAMEYTFAADDSGISPTSVTVNAGDSIKLIFVFNQPNIYFGGIDVRSSAFDTVIFQTSDEDNVKTVELTAESTFTMSAYWPASNILKGSATVNVQ